ncbi:MAG: hypothetical protein Q9167_001685 [Letrouitia subvulpina]
MIGTILFGKILFTFLLVYVVRSIALIHATPTASPTQALIFQEPSAFIYNETAGNGTSLGQVNSCKWRIPRTGLYVGLFYVPFPEHPRRPFDPNHYYEFLRRIDNLIEVQAVVSGGDRSQMGSRWRETYRWNDYFMYLYVRFGGRDPKTRFFEMRAFLTGIGHCQQVIGYRPGLAELKRSWVPSYTRGGLSIAFATMAASSSGPNGESLTN